MGDAQHHPIELLINYWEFRSSKSNRMGEKLDELLRHGISHLATFVPWQAVESDISHTLARFLQAVAERKMTVKLILTPEVGVHYPNSGLPKDIFSKPENLARHAGGGAATVNLPPNSFALPSLASPEFMKRYHNFLSRIDNLLADLGRQHPHLLSGVTAVLSGSYWKYYRAPKDSSTQAFGGMGGDYSGYSAVAYRQRLEQFYSQREFMEPNPAAANRWKARAYEDINRRWFYQHSEDVFRNRSTQFVRRKALPGQLQQIELFTPEADPGYSYSNFLQMISGAHADFNRLSALIDEAGTRASQVGDQPTRPQIHWTGLGGFRTLSDSEKQFLILKSILVMGGRGGGLLIDEEEWFALSQSFRTRAEALARLISQGDLRLSNRALYLAPHLWSSAGTLWDELQTRLGPNARLAATVDRVIAERDANLVLVDPAYILTREVVQKLTEWARSGRVVVLPRSPLYTEAAREELEKSLASSNRMDIDLGISYGLHVLGEGKLIVYDLPEGVAARGEALSSWQTFLASVLSVAGLQSYCNVSDGRLKVIPLEKSGGGLGLFILNGTGRPVAADLLFQGEVSVSDLSLSFVNERAQDRPDVVPANRFALEVPPCGILPIAVDGIGVEAEERRAAAMTSGLVPGQLSDAANAELPGFSAGEDLESTWN